jgi:hypothetical protein
MMKISIVAFDDFTDLDLFILWGLLKRVAGPDWQSSGGFVDDSGRKGEEVQGAARARTPSSYKKMERSAV